MCGYGLNEPECDRPATWHVLWRATNHTSSACDEHMHYVRENAAEQEKSIHPYCAVCDLPGTFFFIPRDPETQGWCYFSDVPSVRTVEAIEAWLGSEPGQGQPPGPK